MRISEAEQYLGGAQYPTRREDLAELARDRGARQAVYSYIRHLPDREYRSVIDVVEALGPNSEPPRWLE